MMKRAYKYRKLNAFASGNSSGNPAACLFPEPGEELSDAAMQAIAREHKGFVSEVIYCTPLGGRRYGLRYFSSECEVEFCGHGTIACMYDLIRETTELKGVGEVEIRTNRGDLTVYNEIDTLDAVFITAPDPEILPVPVGMEVIARNLGLEPESIDRKLPLALINAGLRTLIVPIVCLPDLLGVRPDEATLKVFCLEVGIDIDIILVFTPEVADPRNAMRTRVFAPRFGYLEDPATGSGNSAFGYYMISHGLWAGEAITIEQNDERVDSNIVHLKTHGRRVLFGGNAVSRIEGVYLL